MAEDLASWLVTILPDVVRMVKQVGAKIRPYFGKSTDVMRLRYKRDSSPLTAADMTAHECLQQALLEMTPDIAFLSEESQPDDIVKRRHWSRYWLVDPLDGTRGFVEGSEEFTVNIALIDNHQPVLGVIYAPMLELCYYAIQGGAAYKLAGDGEPQVISTERVTERSRVIVGRKLTKPLMLKLLKEWPNTTVYHMHSSLKFCYLAEGKADVYPRLGPTGEWDTAAAQCILQQAGGCVVDLDGKPLQYNASDSLINPPFVALGDPSQSHAVRAFINEKRRSL